MLHLRIVLQWVVHKLPFQSGTSLSHYFENNLFFVYNEVTPFILYSGPSVHDLHDDSKKCK